MLYILAAAIAVLLGVRLTSPKRYNVRASRPAGVHRHPDRWIMSGLAIDASGKPVDTSDKFVGRVDGFSMAAVGIPNGSTIIASYLTPEERKKVSAGDIVVVKDAHPDSEEGEYCLRRIKSVSAGVAEYFPDFGGDHDPHGEDQVVAIVTKYVPIRKLTALFPCRNAVKA